MDFLVEIEYEAEAYTSLWLTQRALTKWYETEYMTSGDNEDLKCILKKPHVFVFRHPHGSAVNQDFGCLVTSSYKGRRIAATRMNSLSRLNNTSRPFAVVVILSPARKRNVFSLSKTDIKLLEYIRQVNQVENAVYILRETNRYGKFEIENLDVIGREIQDKIYGKMECNTIFNKLFSISDSQIPVRIGHCLHYSILFNIQNLHNKITNVLNAINTDLKCLTTKRNLHTEILTRKIENTNVLNMCALEFLTSHKIVKTASNYLATVVDIHNDIPNHSLHESNVYNLLKKSFPNRLEKLCPRTNKTFSKTFRNNGSIKKAIITRSKPERSFGGISKCRPLRRRRIHAEEMRKSIVAEELYDEFLEVFTEYVSSYNEKLTDISKTLQDELNKGKVLISLHEWKTVSERINKVKGFGYIDGMIHIYLKQDNEDCKTEVEAFFKKYLRPERWNQTVKFEFKQRKITLFSNLEQGSKINKSNIPECDKIKYGSLGMFLEDSNGKYFFTTCAHVIEYDGVAYSPEDNSILGRSVLVYDSNTADEREVRLDFSLVHVSPDRNLTCTFGLKTVDGNFTQGKIFKGDITEIHQCPVYIWGASEPYLKRGRCVGYEYEQDENGPFLCLEIDNNDFAKPGDSGALICLGDDTESGLAAFVLVGGSTDKNSGEQTTYVVYKVSDALDKISSMRNDVKPCLYPHTISVPIATASGESRNSPKRKRGNKVLPPRSVKRIPPSQKE